MERGEFTAFTGLLLKEHQGTQALGWAPRIAAAQRPRHEKDLRAEGFTKYEITVRDARGRSVPAGMSAEYCPVLFVEPLRKNQWLLGFDLRSDPAWRSAIDQAMGTGQMAVAVRRRKRAKPIACCTWWRRPRPDTLHRVSGPPIGAPSMDSSLEFSTSARSWMRCRTGFREAKWTYSILAQPSSHGEEPLYTGLSSPQAHETAPGRPRRGDPRAT